MSRKCPKCEERFSLPTFKLWDGRCAKCFQPITWLAKRDEERNQQRPKITSEEFMEFLKHADDLAVIRLREDEVFQISLFVILGGFLFLFGVFTRNINFAYGMFFMITMGVIFACVYIAKICCKCPRCHKKYSDTIGLKIGFPGIGVRLMPSSERCQNCGLRALSSFDTQRYLREETEDAPLIEDFNESSLN